MMNTNDDKELFSTKSIKCSTVPVCGMADLQNVYLNMVKDKEDLDCIFMLNCGGNMDLFEVFQLDVNNHLLIFVADSHRPYHPLNVKNAQHIFLLDDSSDQEVSYEADEEEIESMAQLEQTVESSEEEEEEEEDGEMSLIEDDDDSTEQIYHRSSKRKKSSKESSNRVGLVAASERSTHGFTAAGLLYALSLQNGVNRKDMLWYSILGLTDQYVHQRIGGKRYLGDIQFFHEKVKNLEIDPSESAKFVSSSSSNSSTDAYSMVMNDPHYISYSPREYIFMLYRHWNLYDSMYHTRPVAVRLGVWGHQGKKNLEQWLARMGMPLEECRQKFVAMKKKFKDMLPKQLEKYSSEFNVQNLYVPSFIRRPSFDKEMSAFDVVYGASALLESIKSPANSNPANSSMEVDTEEDFLKANFWNALRSLHMTNTQTLDEGIDEAIELQCAIVRQASMMIQRQEVAITKAYRYAFVKDTPDLKYFTHPLALSKLAHFLVDILIESGNSKIRPLIINVQLQYSKCLVLGVPGQHSGAPHVPNRFGKAFANAAMQTNTNITYNSFDTYVVEINKSDLERFTEYLRTGLVIA